MTNKPKKPDTADVNKSLRLMRPFDRHAVLFALRSIAHHLMQERLDGGDGDSVLTRDLANACVKLTDCIGDKW